MAENKKYCCSNSLRLESLVAAVFDTLVSVFAVCSITVFYFIVDESWLSYGKDDKNIFGLQDLRRFLELDVEIRELSVLILTTLITLHILMNSLLLTGIYKRNSIMLKIWFVCGIVTLLIALTLFFNFIYITRDKIVHSCIFGFYILFYIYFLWVIKLFLKELVTVSFTSEEQLHQDTNSKCGEGDSISSNKY